MPKSEVQTEKAIDRAVMRRLATDRAYLNAENAEEQAEREQQIADEEYERFHYEMEHTTRMRELGGS